MFIYEKNFPTHTFDPVLTELTVHFGIYKTYLVSFLMPAG